ncbi:hypothetical protein CK203_062671 [Vitis vinifera]|uniref:Uncharacterized protein n=1 Tax=Vitis vinifera TaxID=29760 RepID=A0A438FRT8_VITVI|nr:hypothetical protein CK203_062671 [Vitis vinifera]
MNATTTLDLSNASANYVSNQKVGGNNGQNISGRGKGLGLNKFKGGWDRNGQGARGNSKPTCQFATKLVMSRLLVALASCKKWTSGNASKLRKKTAAVFFTLFSSSPLLVLVFPLEIQACSSKQSGSAFIATLELVSNQSWYANSGATSHVTTELGNLLMKYEIPW